MQIHVQVKHHLSENKQRDTSNKHQSIVSSNFVFFKCFRNTDLLYLSERLICQANKTWCTSFPTVWFKNVPLSSHVIHKNVKQDTWSSIFHFVSYRHGNFRVFLMYFYKYILLKRNLLHWLTWLTWVSSLNDILIYTDWARLEWRRDSEDRAWVIRWYFTLRSLWNALPEQDKLSLLISTITELCFRGNWKCADLFAT